MLPYATDFKPSASVCTASGSTASNSWATTPVALEIDGQLKVSENQWSVTTGRHLTWIDGGNKKARLKL